MPRPERPPSPRGRPRQERPPGPKGRPSEERPPGPQGRPSQERPPIGLHLAHVAKTASRAFDEALAQAGGSLPTWLVLISVKARESASQREIAEAAGIQGATLTHPLNALEAAGLVTRPRDPANRRVHVVELPPRATRCSSGCAMPRWRSTSCEPGCPIADQPASRFAQPAAREHRLAWDIRSRPDPGQDHALDGSPGSPDGPGHRLPRGGGEVGSWPGRGG
jgi:DNA-binding HxlR family transcriptional regulator